MGNFFEDLVDGVRGIAPSIIGTAVNTVVPGAGGIASDMVEGIMRSITGDDTSDIEDVAEVIAKTPELRIKFEKIMADKEVEFARIAADAYKHINDNTTEQMGNETKSEHWAQWMWRPWCGFWFPPAAIYAIHNGNTINTVVLSIVFTMWGSILGVSAYQRGKQKRELAGNIQPGLVQGLISKLMK